LAARGHDVTIFATQLEAPGLYRGVSWQPAESLGDVLRFMRHDLFVSLRHPGVWATAPHNDAMWRWQWNQDLYLGPQTNPTANVLPRLDRLVYVSQFHREQWEAAQPLFAPLGWATVNPVNVRDAGVGTDADVYTAVPKRARHLIHISRPERGLDAILAWWPDIRAAYPDVTLAVCRYASMYDAGGWGRICAQYDRRLEDLHARVGGIEWLGELNKPRLYQALAQAEAMFYPTSQAGFAETNCVAATEAQLCGTYVLGSYVGALPETCSPDAATLIPGEWRDPAVKARFLAAIGAVFTRDDATVTASREAGRTHVLTRATGREVAEGWEARVAEDTATRFATRKMGVLRQLLRWDRHLDAHPLAAELAADPDPAVREEAAAARTLCARVIAGEENQAEDYATYALADAAREAETNTRLHRAAELIVEALPKAPCDVLDVACGNGAFALALLARHPHVHVVGLDYSPDLVRRAEEAVRAAGFAGRFTGKVGGWDVLEGEATTTVGRQYLGVFCGEFVEHVAEPWRLLDALEHRAAVGARVVVTTPCGPFSDLLERGTPRKRGHVHAFDAFDLAQLGGQKADFQYEYLPVGFTARGLGVGFWIVQWTARPTNGPAGTWTWGARNDLVRPYERLTALLIVKDEANWLRGALESVWPVVDRILVTDTGSRDGTREIVTGFDGGGVQKTTLLTLPWPGRFDVARNHGLAVAEAEGTEWILWCDADERLIDGHGLARVIEGAVMHGFVVEQRHLCADQPDFTDKPARLFRANRGVRWIGYVHEQPEEAPDVGVNPTMHQRDAYFLHYGYPIDGVRREKMLRRNLPLVAAEMRDPACRELLRVLYLRDCVNLGIFDKERHGGEVSPTALRHFAQAVKVYEERSFDDPESKFHPLAWPFYQLALMNLGVGIEAAWAFAATNGKLPGVPKPERFRVRTLDELRDYLVARLDQWIAKARPLAPMLAPPSALRTTWGLPETPWCGIASTAGARGLVGDDEPPAPEPSADDDGDDGRVPGGGEEA
jgi:glycosyltransferase involved in cell wall biosynthesis/SAM-dependent methyltransferase